MEITNLKVNTFSNSNQLKLLNNWNNSFHISEAHKNLENCVQEYVYVYRHIFKDTRKTFLCCLIQSEKKH